MTYNPHAQAISPLFRLPRELRDQIWDHTLHGTAIHILKENHVITLACPSPNLHTDPEPTVNIPRWLLASKQTLSEGLEQFSRTGACTRVAPHEKPWLCALAPLAVTRDALLLQRVRNLNVHLNLNLVSNDYNKKLDGSLLAMSMSGGPHGDLEPRLPCLSKCGFTVHQFLPNLENLHLRLKTHGLERAPRPKHITLSVTSLRCLGTNWKRVCISILKPELCLQWRQEDPEAPCHIAPLAATYPRVQKTLVMLGGHLTRHLGRLPPAKPGEHWPSAEYRESGFWFVSEVAIHPCEAYEPSEYDKVERWFKIDDALDEETGEWQLDIEEKPGKGENQHGSKVLQHTGLRDWIQKPMAVEKRDHVRAHFTRDKEAKIGGHRSWTCEETGKMVWIEDKEKAVTGYTATRDDGKVQRRFLQEPEQPRELPPWPPSVCRMPFS